MRPLRTGLSLPAGRYNSDATGPDPTRAENQDVMMIRCLSISPEGLRCCPSHFSDSEFVEAELIQKTCVFTHTAAG